MEGQEIDTGHKVSNGSISLRSKTNCYLTQSCKLRPTLESHECAGNGDEDDGGVYLSERLRGTIRYSSQQRESP